MPRDDAVLFVGSGVSAWSGLPTWAALIAELCAFLDDRGIPSHLVRRELDRANLLQAASFGFDQLTPNDRTEFLRQACRLGEAEPSVLHRKVATLGPRCFITTNYDKLLERTLIEERGDLHFTTVNNTSLVEVAGIIQSRSQDFVFKPHGDVDAIDSVILTREDYRRLTGDLHNAFDGLKTLLASRPVIFVGFGLQDPDFLLIKDTLANIYRGAAQDHYAIVPDADPEELSYWRKNYGIHITSYATRPGTGEPHGGLLDLLEELAATPAPGPASPAPDSVEIETDSVLAVLRHAKRMAQLAPAASRDPIPLVATSRSSQAPGDSARPAVGFYEADALTALQRVDVPYLLTGPPGAGKTFAMRTVVARMAEGLIDDTRADASPADLAVVPIYIELKAYTGDLWTTIVESLPVGFPFERVVADGKARFFLDGLNEVPTHALEGNALRDDLEHFLVKIGECGAVLSTRFSREYADLDLAEVEIDAIADDYLSDHLEDLGLSPDDITSEVFRLLKRPFYFRFFRENRFPPGVTTPHAIYRQVMEGLSRSASERFGVEVDIDSLFAELAYERIDAGEQLMPLDVAAERVEATYGGRIDSHALINSLIASGVLVAGAESRFSFFHHSVTEYLAGYQLARLYEADRGVLRHRLKARQWDHAVLLALGFLERERRREFFDAVMDVDPLLGIRALAFVEVDREEWTAVALRRAIELELPFEERMAVAHALERVQVEEDHAPLLEEIARAGDRLGGAALGLWLGLPGPDRCRHAIETLFEHPGDFNFGSALGPELAYRVTQADLDLLFERLGSFPLSESDLEAFATADEVDQVHGLVQAAAPCLAALDLDELADRLRPWEECPALLRLVLFDRLRDDDSVSALAIAVELLKVDPGRAAVALYFHLRFRGRGEEDVKAALVPVREGPILVGELAQPQVASWSAGALIELGRLSSAWTEWLLREADARPPGAEQAMLLHAAGEDDRFLAAIAVLLSDPPALGRADLEALAACGRISWEGNEDLLIGLLRLRDEHFAVDLLDHVLPIFGDATYLQGHGLGDLDWWVAWLCEQVDAPQGRFLKDRLGRFIAIVASDDEQKALLEVFENGDPLQRRALGGSVLGHMQGLQLGDLTPAAVEQALDLLGSDSGDLSGSVLVTLATEGFMEETILPLLRETDEEPLRSNLVELARQVGREHRRRYVSATGDVVL